MNFKYWPSETQPKVLTWALGLARALSLAGILGLAGAIGLSGALLLAGPAVSAKESLSQTPSALRALTTLPDLAEIIQTIGGERVQVQSLLTGHEDPHYVDARPDFVAQASRADLLCSMGLDLEVGWLPRVLSRSGNRSIQRGGPGFCEAGRSVRALDVPSGPIDRSMGDLHPHGNPHFNLSPRSMAQASEEVLRVMVGLRPEWQSEFESRQKDFVQSMVKLEEAVREKLQVLKTSGAAPLVIEYHQEFTYFLRLYNIPSLGSIEEKPGVAPSAAHLAQVAQRARENSVRLALANPSSPRRTLRRFEQLSGVKVLRLPLSIKPSHPELATIARLQHHLADQLILALGTKDSEQGVQARRDH